MRGRERTRREGERTDEGAEQTRDRRKSERQTEKKARSTLQFLPFFFTRENCKNCPKFSFLLKKENEV